MHTYLTFKVYFLPPSNFFSKVGRKWTNAYSTNFFCIDSDGSFPSFWDGGKLRNLEKEKLGVCVNQPPTNSAPTH